MEKKWTVYQIENRINSRLYIGVHKTVDPNDSYMGSGKLIRYAIKKHGIENFSKKILLVTEDKAEAFKLEAELVTLDRIASGELYNLKEGGEGGWDHLRDRKDLQVKGWNNGAGKTLGKRTPARIEHYAKIPRKWKSRLGSVQSSETKAKIGNANRILQTGKQNSRFGSQWVTNGIDSKSVSPELAAELIAQGWRKGRKMKVSTCQ